MSPAKRTPELEDDLAPDWSPVPERLAPGGPSGPAPLRRVALAAVFAVALWLLGHPILAIVVVGATLFVTAVSGLFPSAASRIERAERAIERGAGRLLTFVVMGGVMMFVMTPLWLVLRLLGRDPLALGQTGADPTFWRPTVRWRRPLYKRPFAYERMPPRAGGSLGRGLRVRAALGLVVVVALADIAVGAVLEALRPEYPKLPNEVTASNVPAGRNEPWPRLRPEVAAAFDNWRYDPFLGWKVSDYDAKYVNVSNGVRRSYQPAGGEAADAVRVAFFGGSAMFGAYQRDQHTIPSAFAHLAEADGIPVHVMNYGQGGYVNWQEVLQLESQASGGVKPDLAVFYDGFNDLSLQFTQVPHRQPTRATASAERRRGGDNSSLATALYRAWAAKSALHRLGRRVGIFPRRNEPGKPLLSQWAGNQWDRPARRGANAVSIYSRGVDLVKRLANSYGFRAAFFWQPSVYSKRVVGGEEPALRTLGADPDAWRTATRVARSRLEPPVVDLSDALDSVKAPVMYDFVHTNEAGARVIAKALYGRLRPALQHLARAKRP